LIACCLPACLGRSVGRSVGRPTASSARTILTFSPGPTTAALRRKEAERLKEAIDEGYSHNWIIDNLPAASVTVDDVYQTTYYSRGFLVGGKDEKGQYFLNNHVRIYLDYHQVRPSPVTRQRSAGAPLLVAWAGGMGVCVCVCVCGLSLIHI